MQLMQWQQQCCLESCEERSQDIERARHNQYRKSWILSSWTYCSGVEVAIRSLHSWAQPAYIDRHFLYIGHMSLLLMLSGASACLCMTASPFPKSVQRWQGRVHQDDEHDLALLPSTDGDLWARAAEDCRFSIWLCRATCWRESSKRLSCDGDVPVHYWWN